MATEPRFAPDGNLIHLLPLPTMTAPRQSAQVSLADGKVTRTHRQAPHGGWLLVFK